MTELTWTLLGIPIPPSINNAYPQGKNGRRFKSKELIAWEKDFKLWAFQNKTLISRIQKAFEVIPTNYGLKLHIIYAFKRERLLSKAGKPKKLDVDNRLKYIIDQITEAVGIDDSYVWSGSFEKRITNAQEGCSVSLGWIMGIDPMSH